VLLLNHLHLFMVCVYLLMSYAAPVYRGFISTLTSCSSVSIECTRL